MRLVKNSGIDRVVDALREVLRPETSLDIASPAFSLFAFAEVRSLLEQVASCRLILPTIQGVDLNLVGSEVDRPFAIVSRSDGSLNNAEMDQEKGGMRGAPACSSLNRL